MLFRSEREMQEEQVVYSQERYRVHETLGIQETLEVVVLFILFDVLFQLIDVEVSLSMPLLVFEVFHISNRILPCEARFQVESSCFEWSVVDNR